MTFIHLDTRSIQKLIMHNKLQINTLDEDRQYLEGLIKLFWGSCNPLDKDYLSAVSFDYLNKAKGNLAVVKKRMKMLTELQYSLKYSIR